MRDLTQEEIDLAPDWATHYKVFDDGDISFESLDFYTWLINGVMPGIVYTQPYGMAVEEGSEPIPRKPFDISEHVFSDRDFNILQEGDNVLVEIDCDRSLFGKLNKADAIAIAKALGVVGSDL